LIIQNKGNQEHTHKIPKSRFAAPGIAYECDSKEAAWYEKLWQSMKRKTARKGVI